MYNLPNVFIFAVALAVEANESGCEDRQNASERLLNDARCTMSDAAVAMYWPIIWTAWETGAMPEALVAEVARQIRIVDGPM